MNIDNILKIASVFEEKCESFLKSAFIKEMPNGKYRVLSEKGRNLGTYDSKEKAKKRLRQVEYFKHLDKNHISESTDILDLTDADDFSLSAMMRKIKEKGSKEQFRLFLKIFKKCFDSALKEGLQKPEKIAIQNALVKFNKFHKIKLNKKLTKNATLSELGDAKSVGKYLSNIIKFTINRIKPENRGKALVSLKNKIYNLSETELSMKNMPASSSMGQSITFVKHVLFHHDSRYIRDVLNEIVRNL